MTAVDALMRGRARAEARMLDTCTIGRQTGTTTDPDTGQVVATYDTVYQGKCKVQSKNSATATPDAGGHSYVVVSRQVHIPVGDWEIRENDVVTITAAPLSPPLVGAEYRVEGFEPDTFETAFRIPVKAVAE